MHKTHFLTILFLMFEDFLNALQNFKRQKTRTFLSLLGVIIGVASVIVITSIILSSTEDIKKSVGSSGLNVVQVSGGFMRKKRSGVTIKLDDSFRSKMFDNIEGIKHIWYKNSVSATLSYADVSSSNSCSAVEYGYLEMYGVKLENGRYFNITEDYYGLQKIILGSTIAVALFPNGDAIGKNILLTTDKVSFSFEVIGVTKAQNAGMENPENEAYIPRGFYAKKIQPNPSAQVMMVEATSPEKAATIVETIQSYCDKLAGTEYSVYVMSMQAMLDSINEVNSQMSLLLSAIAAISLLVGGIGIMNIMIVTVTERRQEIGIRKALGATRFDISRQFLVESASITLLGGTLGIFIGIAISIIIEKLKNQAIMLSFNACLISFVFSLFVGIFFGLHPALRAAKLDPVLALQGE